MRDTAASLEGIVVILVRTRSGSHRRRLPRSTTQHCPLSLSVPLSAFAILDLPFVEQSNSHMSIRRPFSPPSSVHASTAGGSNATRNIVSKLVLEGSVKDASDGAIIRVFAKVLYAFMPYSGCVVLNSSIDLSPRVPSRSGILTLSRGDDASSPLFLSSPIP